MSNSISTAKWIKRLHFFMSLGFMVLSFGLSILVLGQDRLLARTLSNVGLHNNTWFIIFSISFSLACMLNLEHLKLKLGIRGLKGALLSVLLFFNYPLP